MNVLKIAAFSDGDSGGNPAGVVIVENQDALPPAQEMQALARAVGFSETVFAVATGSGWRVRYFSPESEVAFCGHATIALGAAFALTVGAGKYLLHLNQGSISVEAQRQGELIAAALQSPPTRSRAAPALLLEEALTLFGYSAGDLNAHIAPALIHGGADHLFIAVNSREALAAMKYDLSLGRDWMNRHGLVTVLLAYAQTPQRFHTRNPFASGGVYEDPATGAASAALAGYLRDIDWPHHGLIDIIQGEDMGMRSRIRAEFTPEKGGSIRLSGSARIL